MFFTWVSKMRQVHLLYTNMLKLSMKNIKVESKLPLLTLLKFLKASWKRHTAWSVRIWSFSGLYFHSLRLNMERYVSHVFSPNVGKYRPEKLPIQTLFTHCTNSKIQKCFGPIHANEIWKSSVSYNFSKHMFTNINFRNFDQQDRPSVTSINSNHGNASSLLS